MDEQELKDAHDLYEVYKMMQTPGWDVCLVSLAADREKIINLVAGAQTKGEARKHDWEYFQGVLAGYLRALAIFDTLRDKYEELQAISIQESRDRENPIERH